MLLTQQKEITMLLKIGGPYLGYQLGEIIEVDDDEGRKIIKKLGADSGRFDILGDLRTPTPAAKSLPSDAERQAAEEEALLAEIANEEAAAKAVAATADDD